MISERVCRYLLVTITETTELLLTSGIPSVEDDGTKVGVESQRMDLNTKGSYGSTLLEHDIGSTNNTG
jgi:hypothetical protein